MVDTKPCCVAYRVALDEPGLRCYQEAVETTSRIGDRLHGKG